MRGRWVWDARQGKVVPADEYQPPKPKRSPLACPMVIGDTMEPVQSMADGKVYDSKSAIRAGYKRGGFIEVGDDPARLRPKPKPQPDRQAIRQSLEKARARVNA